MVKIFTPTLLEGFEYCHPVNRGGFEDFISLINGNPRKAEWVPIEVEIIRDDEGEKLEVSDSPWLGSHALIFRPSAIQVLRPILEEFGELLCLKCNDSKLFVYNPTIILDALVESESRIMRYSDGRIMKIINYVFQSSILGDVTIFKIPNIRNSPTFVSERFVNLWDSENLKGLKFTQVWSA
jgi:hypothetical protein